MSIFDPLKKIGEKIKERVKQKFIEPRPLVDISVIDFLKEIPSSTKKVVGAIGKFAKGIQEEMVRSGAAVGLTLVTPFVGTTEIVSEELTLGQRQFKEVIFGKDPVKSLQTRIAEREIKVAEFGKRVGIEAIEKMALPLAMVGVGAMVGLDFTVGGGKGKVVKTLTKTNKIDDVIRILRKINVADDLIDDFGRAIAKMSKADDVVKALDRVSNIQKTTRVVREVGEEVIEKIPKKVAPKIRQFLPSVSKARPDIPLKVGGQYIPRSTDDLARKAKTLITENIDAAERLARTKTDDKAIATASELIKHYGDEALKTKVSASKNALYDQASEIAHIAAENLTEQGRAVQAASIMGRLTPEGMLRFAAKEINKYNTEILKLKGLAGKTIPKLTTGQTKMILGEMKKIEVMADGTQKAMAFKRLTDTITDLVPTSLYKKIINVWKAGLLTGIKTSGLNTMSNLFHGQTEVIKDVPAVVIDSAISLFSKKRTIALTIKETLSGTKEGFEKGWRYLATGFDERNIGVKLDWRRVSFGQSKFAKGLQKYEETIFHLMGAEDQPFYYGAKARSLMSQAIAKAKNAKLKGGKAKKFVHDLVKSPTDEMLKYATGDAEMSVFQNQTMLGKIARAIQKAPLGEVVVPFGRTPAAVANQLINYSPAGIVKAIAQNIGKGKFDQRLFSQAIGRGITGTAVIYLGTLLFKKGLITLDYPKGERERELWKIEGRKANAIKIGEKWRNVNVLGPAGMVLVTGGYFQRALEETGSITQALTTAMAGSAKALTEQTFLRGVNQVVAALTDPERSAKSAFANTASSIIPTIVGDVARAVDTKERKAPGLLGRLVAKIPGVRATLEPQISVLGEERERAGNWLETMVDPSRPSSILFTPVAQELRRLFDAGYKASPTLLGPTKGYEGLTPEENTALLEKVGELINEKLFNLFNLAQYKNLPDDQKADMVEMIVDKSKELARAQAVMDLTENLSGQTLKDKLSELKEGGLMIRSVFKKYLEMSY